MALFGRLPGVFLLTVNYPDQAWPNVLREALHCIKSLVSFSTNSTSHSLFFNFERNFQPLPNAIPPGDYAWLRRHIRSKNDTTGEIVKIVASYPGYAVVSRDGIHTDTVNWRHLGRPHPGPISSDADMSMESAADTNQDASEESLTTPTPPSVLAPNKTQDSDLTVHSPAPAAPKTHDYRTRFGREVVPPARFGFDKGENVVSD